MTVSCSAKTLVPADPRVPIQAGHGRALGSGACEWAALPLPRGSSRRLGPQPGRARGLCRVGQCGSQLPSDGGARSGGGRGSDPEPLRFLPGSSSRFLSCHSQFLVSGLSLDVSPFPGRSAHFLKVSRVFLSVRGSLAEPAASPSGAGGCAPWRGQLPLARQGDEGSGTSDT